MAKGFELTPGERKALLLILFLCVIGTFLTVRKTNQINRSQGRGGAGDYIAVQIDGAVVNPGIYHLPEGTRVEDAIEYAGGLRAEADISKLNMVAKIKDGQRIAVPFISLPQTAQPTPSSQGTYPSFPSMGKIDINSATPEELAFLPGIGPTLAGRIVSYRQAVGRFNYIEELLNVPGIGEKKLEQIRQYIEVR